MGKKKVLVIHGQPGMGHLMAAKAIIEAFSKKYPDIETKDIDAFDFCYKVFRYGYPFFYNQVVYHLPIIYRIFYNNYENKLIHNFLEKAFVFFAKKKKFVSFIRDFQPDFIIFANPLPTQLITLFKEKDITNILSADICTDFGFHAMWHNKDVNFYFVATDQIKNSLQSRKVSPSKIKTTGIPIRQKFIQQLDRNKVLNNLNFVAGQPILLIVGGQLSYKEILSAILKIKENNGKVQFIIISGRDEKLQKQLEKSLLKKDPLVRIFGLVNNIEDFMAVADLIISKAGGSTTAECLASGLPMVVRRVIPGQEEDNIDYLEKHNAGIRVNSNKELVKAVIDLFSQPAKLAEMKKNCKIISRPNAADDLVDFVASKIK